MTTHNRTTISPERARRTAASPIIGAQRTLIPIYVTLSRMETKGFLVSRQEERPAGAIGLPRRMYRVTAYGLKVHEAYLLLREALALKPAEAH